MRFIVAAVGSLKSCPEADLVRRYVTRLGNFVKIQEIPSSRESPVDLRRSQETQKLLHLLSPSSLIVALDERGENLSTLALYEKFKDYGSIGFMIGGADGFDQKLIAPPIQKISFGAQTWPHALVRALLMEQLYRLHTLRQNHPYHRGSGD